MPRRRPRCCALARSPGRRSRLCSGIGSTGRSPGARGAERARAADIALRAARAIFGSRRDAGRARGSRARFAGLLGAPTWQARLDLSPSGDLMEAAANLFAHLRALDAFGAAAIAVAPVLRHELGVAINDGFDGRPPQRRHDWHRWFGSATGKTISLRLRGNRRKVATVIDRDGHEREFELGRISTRQGDRGFAFSGRGGGPAGSQSLDRFSAAFGARNGDWRAPLRALPLRLPADRRWRRDDRARHLDGQLGRRI